MAMDRTESNSAKVADASRSSTNTPVTAYVPFSEYRQILDVGQGAVSIRYAPG